VGGGAPAPSRSSHSRAAPCSGAPWGRAGAARAPERCALSPPPFHSRPAAAGTLRASPRSALPPDLAALAAAAAPSATLGQGELGMAVRAPPGACEDEWVARHAVDFLDAASLLAAAVSQWCTRTACPTMCAGPATTYLWAPPPPPGAAAPSRGPRPAKLPAPDYCASLFTWADALLADPAALPQARDAPFPPAFRAAVAPLFKRLARVFAHLYHAHFAHVEAIGAVPHLNTVFKHFVAFGRAHALVPERELDPVRELVDALLPPGAGGGGGGGG